MRAAILAIVEMVFFSCIGDRKKVDRAKGKKSVGIVSIVPTFFNPKYKNMLGYTEPHTGFPWQPKESDFNWVHFVSRGESL